MAVKVKKKLGRPRRLSDRLADKICQGILEGKSLRRVCEPELMPAAALVCRWLANPDPYYETFRQQYAHACEERAESFIEEILDIADDGTNDWMEEHYPNGDAKGWKENGEAIQRSKLRVEARKWYASKMKPKKYGDKIDVSSDGKALPTPIIALPIKDAQAE